MNSSQGNRCRVRMFRALVQVALQYLPPVGKVGAFVAHLLGSASEQQLEFLPQPILKSTRNLGLAFLRGYAKNPWIDVGSKVRLVT